MHKLRRRVRRHEIAEQNAVNIRTVDGWARRGVIPPPHYLEGSRIPFWYADELDRLQIQSEKPAS
jgi:predicted site-specific integrase-resolvase